MPALAPTVQLIELDQVLIGDADAVAADKRIVQRHSHLLVLRDADQPPAARVEDIAIVGGHGIAAGTAERQAGHRVVLVAAGHIAVVVDDPHLLPFGDVSLLGGG